MNLFKKLTIAILLLITIISCESDSNQEPYLGSYANGIFVLNEGPFNNGTGTLSYIGVSNVMTHNIYQKANGEELGNIAQSMYLHDDKAYIVINNSHKVIVANRYTMEKIAVIEGTNINNPRYFVAVGNTGYISNWGDASNATDDFIAVIDLNTNTITSTISVGEGPEDMLVNNDTIYINLQGGYGQNNKLEVLNTDSNTVTSSLTIGDVPNSILKDSNGAIWVLCGGKPSWTGSETNGKLIKIENNAVTNTLDFGTGKHPQHLTISNNDLYYNLDGKVYKMAISINELNTDGITGFDGYYYSMKANDNFLYTTNAGDFSSEGTLKVFDLSTNTEAYSKTTGIIPGNIIFQ